MSSNVAEHPYLAIGFLAALFILIAIALYRGRSDGTLNYLSGKLLTLENVDRKKQIYLSVSLSTGQQLSKTKAFYPDQTKPNSSFHYAMPELYPTKSEAVIFEAFTVSDDISLGATEIALDVLKEHSPEFLTRDLKSPQYTLTVQVGLASVHSLFIYLDRFKRALKKNLKLISFWTRLFALPVALWIAYDGLSRFRKGGNFKVYMQGLGQSVLGLYFLWFSVPYYLGYIGITFLENFKNESLMFAWGSAVTISGYIAASHNWLLQPEEVTLVQKMVHIPLAFVSAGYFFADVRGEPGAGWMSWIGKRILGKWVYKEL